VAAQAISHFAMGVTKELLLCPCYLLPSPRLKSGYVPANIQKIHLIAMEVTKDYKSMIGITLVLC
jgi:hypothetical protein